MNETKKSLPLAKVYQLIEPGPVVLLSTRFHGKDNVMTMSWHTMLEFEPPLMGCVVSNRNYSFSFLKKSRECVINIPTQKLGKQTVGCGNASGRRIDKFKRYKLTKVPAARVDAPMIGECYANLECRLKDGQLVESYNFFILEVVKAWIDPKVTNPKTLHHRGRGIFSVPGKIIRWPSKMK